MYIQHKLVSAFYKLSLGLISIYGFWLTISAFGANAWRLFSTWALIIGAIYYCLSALILALSSKRKAGDAPSAMFEGMLIVAFVVQGVAAIYCAINDEYLPGLSGFAAAVAYYALPVLALLDWCLFDKKGQWRPTDPFNWLALPLAYSAMIILTANMLPSSAALRYPIPFLDYNSYGLWEMLSWLAFVGLLILIFGYILVLLDAFMGGVIAKHIVLPHIRTVPVDPELSADTEEATDEESIISEESVDAEPSEAIEPVEIIAEESPRPKRKPSANNSSKPRPSRTRSAKAQSNKTQSNPTTETQQAKAAKSQNSRNSSKTPNPKNFNNGKNSNNKSSTDAKPANKRKINDVTKPKSDHQGNAQQNNK